MRKLFFHCTKFVKSFMYYYSILRSSATLQEARLGWTNNVRKEWFNTIYYNICDNLVNRVAQTNGPKLSKLCNITLLRYEAKISVIYGFRNVPFIENCMAKGEDRGSYFLPIRQIKIGVETVRYRCFERFKGMNCLSNFKILKWVRQLSTLLRRQCVISIGGKFVWERIESIVNRVVKQLIKLSRIVGIS